MTIKVIQQKCAQCGLTRAYDWKQGKSRSENLAMEGWRRIHKSWICPACVSEVRGSKE